MSKQKARDFFIQPCKSVSGWDKAIADAEKMIQEAKAKITNLRLSIKAFKELRDSGEPFPGEAKSDAAQK